MEKQLLKTSHAVALPNAEGKTAPELIQLLPAGTFTGRDGRGPYTCEPVAVVARTREMNGNVDIPVDYEHQIERAVKNGQPAPAAAWIIELEARSDGVWGRVDWTDKGQAHILAREYRYVSPVYYFDRTGAVQAIASVALTNVPNLTVMKALASFAEEDESAEPPVSPEERLSFLLSSLASALDLGEADLTEKAIISSVRTLARESKEMRVALSKAMKAQDGAPGDSAKAAQSVPHQAAAYPDLTKFVSVDAFETVNTELSGMKAAQALELVSEAMKQGKITPAMEDWALETVRHNPESFKAYMSMVPDLRPGAGARQYVKSTPPPWGTLSKLDAGAKTVCEKAGISEEQYAKAAQAVAMQKNTMSTSLTGNEQYDY